MKWILTIGLLVMTLALLARAPVPPAFGECPAEAITASEGEAIAGEESPACSSLPLAVSDEQTPGQRSGGAQVNTANNKKSAEFDVLNQGPEKLDEKLSHYAEDAVVWDSVMRVLGFSETNKASGIKEVTRFFTWLAGLPPVKVKIVNIFGEGDKVAVEWILTGGEGAGKFEILCANIYDFERGKIKSVRMQFDSAYFASIVKK
jgi:hypothetical protein